MLVLLRIPNSSNNLHKPSNNKKKLMIQVTVPCSRAKMQQCRHKIL